ncbi:MAG: hypothetical protein CFE24_05960 [Flavobacterium sp. BFFFF2]|nr:MAG: hypothetical protein CFE24_05960 [Flavobacterium sp. BFFFF2]
MSVEILTKAQQATVVAAIEAAEHQTSGEIRIHLEKKCAVEPIERAHQLFLELGMQQTQARNGVLIYVAYDDRKMAICGDEGIHAVVGDGFWQSTYELMRKHFAQDQLCEGLIAGVDQAGQQLKKYFPYQTDDQNELPNTISFGNE